MIKNRTASLTVIFFIYTLAVFCGFFTYNYLTDIYSFSYQAALFIADFAATVLVFIFSLIFRNASVYDPYWSVQPPVILGFALVKVSGTSGSEGTGLLSYLLFAAVLFWALRLTAIAEKAAIHPLCLIFVILSLLSAVFQGLADIQMHRFRASGAGGFIRTGLWKHGRHPNYACEILMWWGIGLASVCALGWQNWYLLAGAALNTLMFLFISIPMADKRQSRKPGFAEYKKETRMLF